MKALNSGQSGRLGQLDQPSSVAVVGAGWAGLAAAVRAVQAGHQVTLFEMSAHAGGRARTVVHRHVARDNGQHILIGAYVRSLDLMRTVGVDTDAAFKRLPLALLDGCGEGLRLPQGNALLSFARGVLRHSRWPLSVRLALLMRASVWLATGFRCEPDRPVSQWASGMADVVQRELLEPLCVAALNTPSHSASAATLLRVLRDALFAAPGSADLLLPRWGLTDLLAAPAQLWLQQRGAGLRCGHRVRELQPQTGGWAVDGERFGAVILACPPAEAARLAAPHAAHWSSLASGFMYEPIITAWLEAPAVHMPFPMVRLDNGPAQFAFDLGALDTRRTGQISLVCSGAAQWILCGAAQTEAALRAQLDQQLVHALPSGYRFVDMISEKRATFRCTPVLERPSRVIAANLLAAGDYVAGPYPATLEGAVRSGEAAVQQLFAQPSCGA